MAPARSPETGGWRGIFSQGGEVGAKVSSTWRRNMAALVACGSSFSSGDFMWHSLALREERVDVWPRSPVAAHRKGQGLEQTGGNSRCFPIHEGQPTPLPCFQRAPPPPPPTPPTPPGGPPRGGGPGPPRPPQDSQADGPGWPPRGRGPVPSLPPPLNPPEEAKLRGWEKSRDLQWEPRWPAKCLETEGEEKNQTVVDVGVSRG